MRHSSLIGISLIRTLQFLLSSTAKWLRLMVVIAALFWSEWADAQALTELVHSFGYSDKSGSHPRGTLIQGSDGVLYGTTEAGGAYGLGVVFRLNTDGTGYAVLRSFTGGTNDGYGPT